MEVVVKWGGIFRFADGIYRQPSPFGMPHRLFCEAREVSADQWWR